MKCKDCKFYFAESSSCHRFPPILIRFFIMRDVYGGDSGFDGVVEWPYVSPTDFCGEFKPWPKIEMEEMP